MPCPLTAAGTEAEARRIYWQPGAVLKLAVLCLQADRKLCCVCAETFASDADGRHSSRSVRGYCRGGIG